MADLARSGRPVPAVSIRHAGIARLQVLAAAALFSTGGAAIKAASLTGWQVAGFRSGVAALALLLFLPGARRGFGWRPALVGVAYAATLILFVLGNKLTTAANTIFLQSTAPVYLILLGPFLLKEHARARDLLWILVLGAGMSLFFLGAQEPLATAPDPRLGNLLAIASGVAWAFTVGGLRWLGREPAGGEGSAMAAVVTGNLFAFLFCLPMALPVASPGPADALVILYLGVFQIGLAYVCLSAGLRQVPALEASLLLLVEPVLNPIWAWAVHGERPGALPLAGGAIILVATLARSFVESRRDVIPAPSPD